MKSRKRISRKLIFSAAVGTVFLAFYLHFGLLPGASRVWAMREIARTTGHTVEFSKALYLPWEGISLRDITVADKKGYLLFSADKLAVNLRLWPFLKENKIIVSNLLLDRPVYEIHTEPARNEAVAAPIKTQISGQIDVPVVSDERKISLETVALGPDAFLPENVYLEQIEIQNGIVRVRKNSSGPVLEEIHSIQVRMGFQKPPKLSFEGSVRLGHSPYALITLKGQWDLNLANYEFYLETKSDSVPSWFLDYQKKHFLVLNQARFTLTSRLKSLNETLAVFHSVAELNGAEISVGRSLYRGAMKLDVQGLFDLDAKRFDRYRGTLELQDVEALNLTKSIPRLEKLNGRIHFQPDLLQIADMKGVYKGLPFQTDGSLRSFKELDLDETVRMTCDIRNVLALVPGEQKRLLEGFEIEGPCQTLTNIRGSLRQTDRLKVEHNLRLTNGTVRNPSKKIDAKNVTADIFLDPAGIRLENSRFTLSEKNYSLNAWIPKAKDSPGSVSLSSEDLSLDASYRLQDQSLAISSAQLKTRGIVADFSGKTIGWDDPVCDFEGRYEMDLAGIGRAFAKEAPFLKNLRLGGIVKGPFALKGAWNQPAAWELKLDGSSPFVTFEKKMRLLDFEMQARMKDGFLKVPYYRADGYEGTLRGTAAFDLNKSGVYFDGKIFMNEMDLGLLMRDLDESKKEISGLLNFQTSLNGFLNAPDSLGGKGHLSIREGRLFKTNLFRQMGHLPFVRVEGLDLVEFTSLNGTFEIRDRRAWTQDLWLLSETVDLLLEGSMGFDLSLDLRMNIRYSDSVILGAYDTGGMVPFVVQQAEGAISQYKVSGSLKEPRYDKILI